MSIPINKITGETKMKKAISLILALICCLTMSMSVYASENVGVSPFPPVTLTENFGGVGVNGASKPGLAYVWNIVDDGTYTISGYCSSWSDGLYTNYYFTGKSSYAITITNHTNTSVQLDFYGWLFHYMTESIAANTTRTVYFDTAHAERTVSSSTQWLIHFSAPCDIDGTIS